MHYDLCGPMSISSTNGKKYLVISIDDYTRMYQVYLSKHNYDAFETFKNFHVWIESEAPYCIGTIFSDNGT